MMRTNFRQFCEYCNNHKIVLTNKLSGCDSEKLLNLIHDKLEHF